MERGNKTVEEYESQIGKNHISAVLSQYKLGTRTKNELKRLLDA